MFRFSFLLILVFLTSLAFTQNKFEKEARLKEDQVPIESVRFIEPQKLDTKVKWYFEENFDGNSIEAKFKYEGRRYSVEFDTNGCFQDLEIEVVFGSLPMNTVVKITSTLDTIYSKYKVQKLQLQYSGDLPSFIFFIRLDAPEDKYVLKYEIVVKVKTEDGWLLHELLFDESGKLEKKSRIVFRNTDNLEF